MPLTPDHLHEPILSYVRPAALTLDPDESIGQALEHARALPSSNVILYCYCVDKEGKLVGFVPIRRLLTTAVDAPLRSVMIDDIMAIPSFATVLVAAEYFVNHRLLAFPVVEPNGKLVGVVDVNAFTDEVLVAGETVVRRDLPVARHPRDAGTVARGSASRIVSPGSCATSPAASCARRCRAITSTC